MSQSPAGGLGEVVAAAAGQRVTSLRPVAGGDICDAYVANLGDRTPVFVKTIDRGGSLLPLEAAGLAWLREADGVPVPEVVAVTEDVLILEYVPSGGGRRREAELGDGLAVVHLAGAESWGWERPANLATIALSNEPTDTWADFYGQRRLLPLVGKCIKAGALPNHTLTTTERLVARLPALVGSDERPARLHGDLWGGNVLWNRDGHPWLIDPSCFGGHREVDLAMLRLFGAPGPAFWEAYDARWPLADGWEDRVALYQLLPLLVHALLFGGSYRRSAMAIMDRYAR